MVLKPAKPARRYGAAWLSSLTIGYIGFAWTFNFKILPFSAAETFGRWAAVGMALAVFMAFVLKPVRTRGLPVIAFMLALALSLPLAVEHILSLIEYVRAFSTFLVFLAFCRMTSLERFTTIRILLGTCVFVAVGSVVMAILKLPEAYPLGDMSDEFGPSRLIGMAWHPGILGYSCAIALAAAMWWPTISRRKFLTTGISIVVAGASLYCLVVADSRTGEVAALLTIATGFAMPWLERFCSTKIPRRFLKVVAVLAVLAMFLTPVLFGFLSGGQLTTTTYSDKGQSVRTASVDEREKIWRDMPVAFASNPVTGTGFGADGPLVRGYNPTVGYVTDKRLPFYHSLLVNCLATSGAIGFLAGLWLLLSGALSAVDRLSEVNIERAKVDPLGIANVRAAVLILMATYPFAAAEGALQGDYTSYVVGLIALATLYPLHSNKSNLPLHRPKPRQRRRAPAEQLAAAGS